LLINTEDVHQGQRKFYQVQVSESSAIHTYKSRHLGCSWSLLSVWWQQHFRVLRNGFTKLLVQRQNL